MSVSKVFSGGEIPGAKPVTETEYLAEPENHKVCAKCGTPMRNMNAGTIREKTPPFWKQDRWYCTTCKTQSFSGTKREGHVGIQDPGEEWRGQEALMYCLDNETAEVQDAFAGFSERQHRAISSAKRGWIPAAWAKEL